MHAADPEAIDTDDLDDRADRDNHDPLSRNEYLRPVTVPHSDTARAPDHGMEFLWLTFPRSQLTSPLSRVLASRSNPLSLMREGETEFYACLKMLSNDSKAFKGNSPIFTSAKILAPLKKIDFAISELCNL